MARPTGPQRRPAEGERPNARRRARRTIGTWTLLALLVASGMGIVILIVEAAADNGEIREEASEALLITSMLGSLEIASRHEARLVADYDGGETGGHDHGSSDPTHAHGESDEHVELEAAIVHFRDDAALLGELLDDDEGIPVQGIVGLHIQYEAAIAETRAISAAGGDPHAAYHTRVQVIEGQIRRELLALQRAEADHLNAAVAASAASATAVRWLLPGFGVLLVAVGIVLVRKELRVRTDRLRAMRGVAKAKDEFVASLSHELRTPLTSVVGFLEVLAEPGSRIDENERHELMTLATHEATELANLVDDLLTLARSDSGTLEATRTPVSLLDELEQVTKAVPGFVSVSVAGRAPAACADPQRVRQIIRNLLSNATRYGGDQVGVRLGGSTDRATVAVVDNGTGIDPADRDRVFESYERAHHTSFGHPDSIGLGLAVSLRLARLMGGDLVYRREQGFSVFELSLPAVEERRAADSSRPVPSSSAIESASV